MGEYESDRGAHLGTSGLGSGRQGKSEMRNTRGTRRSGASGRGITAHICYCPLLSFNLTDRGHRLQIALSDKADWQMLCRRDSEGPTA